MSEVLKFQMFLFRNIDTFDVDGDDDDEILFHFVFICNFVHCKADVDVILFVTIIADLKKMFWFRDYDLFCFVWRKWHTYSFGFFFLKKRISSIRKWKHFKDLKR